MENKDTSTELAVWADREGNEYTLSQIDNRYLKNIINFISKGGGDAYFMTEAKVVDLYYEAIRRKVIQEGEYNLPSLVQKIIDKQAALYTIFHYNMLIGG